MVLGEQNFHLGFKNDEGNNKEVSDNFADVRENPERTIPITIRENVNDTPYSLEGIPQGVSYYSWYVKI